MSSWKYCLWVPTYAYFECIYKWSTYIGWAYGQPVLSLIQLSHWYIQCMYIHTHLLNAVKKCTSEPLITNSQVSILSWSTCFIRDFLDARVILCIPFLPSILRSSIFLFNAWLNEVMKWTSRHEVGKELY